MGGPGTILVRDVTLTINNCTHGSFVFTSGRVIWLNLLIDAVNAVGKYYHVFNGGVFEYNNVGPVSGGSDAYGDQNGTTTNIGSVIYSDTV
jgi:hypothetical protein